MMDRSEAREKNCSALLAALSPVSFFPSASEQRALTFLSLGSKLKSSSVLLSYSADSRKAPRLMASASGAQGKSPSENKLLTDTLKVAGGIGVALPFNWLLVACSMHAQVNKIIADTGRQPAPGVLSQVVRAGAPEFFVSKGKQLSLYAGGMLAIQAATSMDANWLAPFLFGGCAAYFQSEQYGRAQSRFMHAQQVKIAPARLVSHSVLLFASLREIVGLGLSMGAGPWAAKKMETYGVSPAISPAFSGALLGMVGATLGHGFHNTTLSLQRHPEINAFSDLIAQIKKECGPKGLSYFCYRGLWARMAIIAPLGGLYNATFNPPLQAAMAQLNSG